MTVTTEIKKAIHRPVRRLYIKRKLTGGTYDADWLRIDKYENKNLIIDWGEITHEVDSTPGSVGSFDISSYTIEVNNKYGHFNKENQGGSIWYTDNRMYLCREYTQIKVVAGFLDSSGAEVDVTTRFEGIIEKVAPNPDCTATINAVSNFLIYTKLQAYDFTQLWAANYPVATAVQNLITGVQFRFFGGSPSNTATPGYNFDISNPANTPIPEHDDPKNPGHTIAEKPWIVITGTVWDNLTKFALASDSIIIPDGGSILFTTRDATGSVVWNFNGVGSDNVNDIISVLQYDDDGAERVRTHWECSGDPIELIISESSDDNILLKYVSEVESVDMSFLKDDTQRQLALDYLLARWETPRPVIEIETKFMGSVVTLLSKVTFNIRGDVLPQTGRFVLDVSKIDGADVLCKELGGVISDPSYEWMVVRIYENLNDFTMRIKAEKL